MYSVELSVELIDTLRNHSDFRQFYAQFRFCELRRSFLFWRKKFGQSEKFGEFLCILWNYLWNLQILHGITLIFNCFTLNFDFVNSDDFFFGECLDKVKSVLTIWGISRRYFAYSVELSAELIAILWNRSDFQLFYTQFWFCEQWWQGWM